MDAYDLGSAPGSAPSADPWPRPLRLGTWPTPLEPAPRLAVALGLPPGDLWIKRDDLTGLGGGGNKVRKLEYTCAAALARGATVLVTTGAAQSNHARLTAAAARRLGLKAVLVLQGGDDAQQAPGTGNLTLDGLLGAGVRWAGAEGVQVALAAVTAELLAQGEVPEVIPFGGSSALGARGYADCGTELERQLPDLAHVVVAVGSGGTMAGLVAALGPEKVLGVDTGAVTDARERVARLVAEQAGTQGAITAQDGAMQDGTAQDSTAQGGAELRLRQDQIGEGYGILSEAARSAMNLAAREEGVILDPVYTAKALAGLVAAVREGDVRPGNRTVFLHTGGMPGLFGHPVAAGLAAAFAAPAAR